MCPPGSPDFPLSSPCHTSSPCVLEPLPYCLPGRTTWPCREPRLSHRSPLTNVTARGSSDSPWLLGEGWLPRPRWSVEGSGQESWGLHDSCSWFAWTGSGSGSGQGPVTVSVTAVRSPHPPRVLRRTGTPALPVHLVVPQVPSALGRSDAGSPRPGPHSQTPHILSSLLAPRGGPGQGTGAS